MDYSIKNLTVMDVMGINNALQTVARKQVTYYIGPRGPFVVSFALSDYTPDAVISAVNSEVASLHAIDSALGIA
jgi:hypothetical protein